MEWSDYIVVVAQRSKNDAQLWFRYLRKYIDKCGTLFTKQDVENLYHNEALTPFQRVSLRAAFEPGTQTRQHIISLNLKTKPSKLMLVREKYDNTDSCE